MGLFSRKSPEEKRLENFNKIEQNVIKLKKSFFWVIAYVFKIWKIGSNANYWFKY